VDFPRNTLGSLGLKHLIQPLNPIRQQYHQSGQLTLPKAFIALETLFGEGSKPQDDPKQAFSFPFLLLIKKSSRVFYYLFEMTDYRGNLSCELYRIVDGLMNIETWRFTMQSPLEYEFSIEEIEDFIQHLCLYLDWITEMLCEIYTDFEPFVHCIDSQRILYGYGEGVFFETKFKNAFEYRKEKVHLERKYAGDSLPTYYQYEETVAFIQNIIKQK